MGRLVDHTGKRYGRLKAIKRGPNANNGAARWWCECDCGLVCVLVANSSLNQGLTKSCGCLAKELTSALFKSHGSSHSAEYEIWCGMKKRCHNPNCKAYPRYGGAGITVCERWFDSFENFLADMGPRPSPKHSIDRIDNDRGYEPDNCRWVTRKTQNANRRFVRLYTYQGETLHLADWAARIGTTYQALYKRVVQRGWPIEKALQTKTAWRGQAVYSINPD